MKERRLHRGPIASCVKSSIERYFQDLNGEKPGHLYEMVIAEVEAPLLEAVMHFAQDNQSQAAKYLGINRNTLRKKLKLYGLD